MIRKYQNYTLQTKAWYREEDPQNIYSNKTGLDKQKFSA